MKIGIVIDSIDNLTNGSIMTARRFADGLRERGHEVRIVAIGADGETDCAMEEKYRPILSEVARKNQTKFAKFDKERVRKAFTGLDVIHFIFPFEFEKKCKRLADEMGIPTTAAFHVQPENVSYNAGIGYSKTFSEITYTYFRERFYRYFNRVHCPSEFIAGQLAQNGYKNKTYVISNGYSPDFVPSEEMPHNEKFEIMMVGRLTPEKNQSLIISAVANSRYRDNIHITLCGNGSNKSKLIKQAKRQGVDLTITFLPKEKLITKLQQSDLYVHASIVEIEAIACLEAIACGLVPVIADSRLSATPQFALDERSLFESENAGMLTDRIEYWYEHPQERAIMRRDYADFAKTFSLETSLAAAEAMFIDEITEHAEKARLVCAAGGLCANEEGEQIFASRA